MSIDIAKAKQTLEALKLELETRIDKIESHQYNPPDDLGEHWDDQVISYQEDDIRENLKIEAQEELVQVNNALLRIENGTYGICSVSGEEIEERRLLAVPYATKCMKHAE